MKFRYLPLCAALSLAWGASAQAQSLVELYEAARAYDASFQSAKALFEANLAKADQAIAGVLPAANLSYNVSALDIEQSLKLSPAGWNYGTRTGTFTASQPLYRPGNWATYSQSKLQAEQSAAALEVAAQDLVVRVSQAYFDVLASQDSLAFVRAQKTAVAEQLASAKRNFEVGTATITDTREAQARYDLVIAQEIAAENDLRVKKIALDQLVGRSGTNPKPLGAQASLPNLNAQEVDTWVSQSEVHHPGVRQARLGLDVAKLDISKAYAGHKPTLDFQISSTGASNRGGGSSSSLTEGRANISSAALVFNLPLFAGMSTQNRVKETLSLEQKAQADLEASRRSVAQATRTAFFGVVSGIGQVKALEAAENSSQVALDANKLGYTVGVRINIDVLNAQSQLFETKAKLAKARYDVLVGGLKLRQASGTLKAEDLQNINKLLAP